MAINNDPIFGKTITSGQTVLTTADASTTAPVVSVGSTVFTANATDGSFVFRLFIKPLGTNAISVLRVFMYNGTTSYLMKELPLPSTTGSSTTALVDYEISLNLKLKAGYKLLVTVGATIAAGVAVIAEAVDYS